MALNISNLNSFVQRNLNRASQQLNKSYSNLTSGERVGSSADDPGAMAMSEGLRYEIQGLRQNQKNVAGGISLIGTAETQVGSLIDNLQSIRELVLQGANDATGATNRPLLQSQIGTLLSQMNTTATTAKYNDQYLLNGQLQNSVFQTGAGRGDAVMLSLPDMRPSALGTPGGASALSAISISDSASAAQALTTVDAALAQLNNGRSALGAASNRLESANDSLASRIDNLTKNDSSIRDADVAFETARMTQSQIIQQASLSILTQANMTPRRALELLQ